MPGLTTDLTDEVSEPEVFGCEHCGYEWSSIEDAESCCPPHVCGNCGERYWSESEALDCCTYSCQHCGSVFEYEDEAIECCWYSCPECGTRHEWETEAYECCSPSSEFNGVLPHLPEIDPYRVALPVLPGRPARLCSVEQELVAGGAMVARLLFEEGASLSSSVQSYHSSSSPRTIHVEEDGSLPHDGGEVVYDRFDLSKPDDIRLFSRCLTRIRQLRDSGSGPNRPVRTGFAAGLHVHVAAKAANGETLTPHGITALYELWCYAEDMLYALSAAGWNRHRQPSDAYGGYCKPVPKGSGSNTPTKVWRLMRSDRYFGLNFQRAYGAATRCSCGAAGMGDWQSCECGAFDSATVEWRVFNASTLPRTIHAWIVFAHAMTAHAARHELGTLPENPMGSQTPAEKREVLDHLLGVLPLTDGERSLIREAADRSPGL